MAVPTLISQLNQTANLNSPGGGEAPFPDADDFTRALSAFAAILRDSGHQWVTSISGTDTITGSVAAGLAAYVAGQKFSFVTAGANTGTAPTVNFNALGAKSITRPDGSSVAVGEIKSGQVVHLVYTGSAMQLMSSTRATTADTATTATSATTATTATTANATSSGATGVTPSTGDNSTKLITSAFMRGEFTSNQSLAAPGYLKLPGGLIVQWGNGSYLSGSTVSFPAAFPTACIGVVTTPDGLASGTNIEIAAVSNLTTTNFIIYATAQAPGGGAWASITATCYWIALGY